MNDLDRLVAAVERIATALEASSGDDDLDTLVQALSAEISPSVPQDAPRGATRQMGGVKRYDLGDEWWIVQRLDGTMNAEGFSLELETPDGGRCWLGPHPTRATYE